MLGPASMESSSISDSGGAISSDETDATSIAESTTQAEGRQAGDASCRAARKEGEHVTLAVLRRNEASRRCCSAASWR